MHHPHSCTCLLLIPSSIDLLHSLVVVELPALLNACVAAPAASPAGAAFQPPLINSCCPMPHPPATCPATPSCAFTTLLCCVPLQRTGFVPVEYMPKEICSSQVEITSEAHSVSQLGAHRRELRDVITELLPGWCAHP